MKKIQITALSVILSSGILSSCGKDEIEKWEEEKEQALIDAEFTDAQTRLDYLQCYALALQEKSKCLLKLNNKKIKPELLKIIFKLFQTKIIWERFLKAMAQIREVHLQVKILLGRTTIIHKSMNCF